MLQDCIFIQDPKIYVQLRFINAAFKFYSGVLLWFSLIELSVRRSLFRFFSGKGESGEIQGWGNKKLAEGQEGKEKSAAERSSAEGIIAFAL